MDSQQELRVQLLDYLKGGHAHKELSAAVTDFPAKLMNAKPENIPYSFWQLLEHIRITQADIVEFIQNPAYTYLDWPKDYWPGQNEKADRQAWAKTVLRINQGLNELKNIIKNPKTNLTAKIPHGEGQTILREALLVIDHTAYHLGEFILMRRIMNAWK